MSNLGFWGVYLSFYNLGAMEFKCGCGVPAKMLKSWTGDNPGRRFVKCQFADANTKRCGFFRWYDMEKVEWQRVVTNELLLEKKILKQEVDFLKAEVCRLQDSKAATEKENEKLLKKVKANASKTIERGPVNVLMHWFVGVVACLVLMFVVNHV